ENDQRRRPARRAHGPHAGPRSTRPCPAQLPLIHCPFTVPQTTCASLRLPTTFHDPCGLPHRLVGQPSRPASSRRQIRGLSRQRLARSTKALVKTVSGRSARECSVTVICVRLPGTSSSTKIITRGM